jgi:hypothetical protein
MLLRFLIYPIRLWCLGIGLVKDTTLCVSLVAICVVCGVKNPEIAFCTSTRGTLRYSDSDFLFLCLWGLLYVGSIWDLIPVLDTVHWHAPFDTSQISFFYDSSAHPLPLML